MYLSCLHFDLTRRDVRRVVTDCRAMHCTLLRAFPTLPDEPSARAACGLLFRAETAPDERSVAVLAQSVTQPDWTRVPEYRHDPVKPLDSYWDDLLTPGRTLAFRLRANPTKQAVIPKEGGGPFTPDKRRALLSDADRMAWLGRKAEMGGFALVTVAVVRRDRAGAVMGQEVVPDVRIIPDDWTRWQPHGGDNRQPLTFGAAIFEGRLVVRDPALLRATLTNGVGRGKAFGFGLLSVMPVR